MRFFGRLIKSVNSPPGFGQVDPSPILKRALILLLCCAMTLFVPAVAQPAAGDFYAQQVDPGTGYDAGYVEMSLALDAMGAPHIGYWAFAQPPDPSYVMHGWKDGTGWHYEQVNVTVMSNPYPSIAVDSLRNPHLCYVNATTNGLNCAQNDGSGWDINPVPDVPKASYISLALDDDDAPHVAYYDSASWKLNYTFWNGTAWKTETVSPYSNQMYPSIAIDSAGYPHISWVYLWPPYHINYAWKNESGWHEETVNATSANSRYTSIALNPATGYPEIAYNDVEGFDVNDSVRAMYAWKWTSGWNVEPVADADIESVSLGITAAGYPRLAYVAPDNTLQLAYRNTTGWHSIEVDDCSGRGPSLAMDPAGYPAISYGKTQSALYYAYYSPVEPDFTADATWGEVPLTVTFTDTSRGVSVAWFWDFGDGNTATEQNPVHTYSATGTYTVTLAASDELGIETVTKTGFITVVEPTQTATPTPTPSPTPSPAPTAAPDGGGKSTTAVDTATDLNAGDTASFRFDESAIYLVVVTAGDEIPDIMITAERAGLPSSISAPNGTIYQYAELTLYRVTDDAIDGAVIEFTVPASWLEENGFDPSDIILYRWHDGAWQDLPTEVLKEENGKVYFRAVSPGCSLFAIIALEGAASVPDTTSAEVPTASAIDTPAATEPPVAGETATPAEEATPETPLRFAPLLAPLAVPLLRRLKK
jgi:PGF-pre-PGF domain-containing protein